MQFPNKLIVIRLHVNYDSIYVMNDNSILNSNTPSMFNSRDDS